MRAASTITFLALWVLSAFTVRADVGQIQRSAETIRSAALQEQPAALAPGNNQELFKGQPEPAIDELPSDSAAGFRECCKIPSSYFSVERRAALISSHLAEQAHFHIRAP